MTIPPDDQIPYGCNVNLNLYQPTPFDMCFLIVYEISSLTRRTVLPFRLPS
jgi:hypothetical protein